MHVRGLAIALLASLGAAVSPCAAALSGPSVFGRVVDPVGAPVGGAQVVVLWQGTLRTAIHGSGAMCLLALATTTDDSGRFAVPGWDKSFTNATIYDYEIRVFKRGFNAPEGQKSGAWAGGIGRVPADGVRITLRPFTGSVAERLTALTRPPARAACAEGGASRGRAVPYYRAMNEEIKALLATPEGQALQRAEQQDRIDRAARHMSPPDTVAHDLDAVIRALENARDGELDEATR